ncbi:MAG: DNA-processing protein DprA [Pseudoflavonifractor sp.]|nr:DNA-processing protein DprA [Pseudoflavonifractor sp.]
MEISPYHIAFGSLKGMTRTLADELLTRVGSEENFFKLPERELVSLVGFDSRLFSSDYRNEVLEKSRTEADFVARHDIRVLYYSDDSYPHRLTDCEDAPILLYVAGDCDLNAAHIVSIVGTRHATPYGNDFTKRMVDGLADKIDSLVIISGLAYGIDVTAHVAALRAGVPTVAVLAHGLNTIYPSAHRNIAADIVHSGGALVTDYRSSDAIHRGNFIARNRIVAALSDCTIVAESAAKGGALITARLASGYCRDVFALPGRTSDRYSAGCNRLIASNTAALVENVDDVIAAMRWMPKADEGTQSEMFVELTPEEQIITDYLTGREDGQINTMCVQTGIPIARLMGLLIDMEFKGLILSYPGGKYRLA